MTTSNSEEGSSKVIEAEGDYHQTTQYRRSALESEFYFSGPPLNARSKAIVRWITFGLFATVFILAAWVYYDSKHSIPSLPEFTIELLQVSELDIKDSKDTSSIWKWLIIYGVRNTVDNMRISYDDISLEVLYQEKTFAEREISSFQQEQGAGASRSISFTTFLMMPEEDVTLKSIGDDRVRGLVSFDIKMHINATFTNIHTELANQYRIVGNCKDLTVRYPKDSKEGSLIGGIQTCHPDIVQGG